MVFIVLQELMDAFDSGSKKLLASTSLEEQANLLPGVAVRRRCCRRCCCRCSSAAHKNGEQAAASCTCPYADSGAPPQCVPCLFHLQDVFAQLQTLCLEHFKEEEEEAMPLMRKHFTPQEIEQNVVSKILSESGGGHVLHVCVGRHTGCGQVHVCGVAGGWVGASRANWPILHCYFLQCF